MFGPSVPAPSSLLCRRCPRVVYCRKTNPKPLKFPSAAKLCCFLSLLKCKPTQISSLLWLTCSRWGIVVVVVVMVMVMDSIWLTCFSSYKGDTPPCALSNRTHQPQSTYRFSALNVFFVPVTTGYRTTMSSQIVQAPS